MELQVPIQAIVAALALVIGLITWQQSRMWKMQDKRLDDLKTGIDKDMERMERQIDTRFTALTAHVNHVSLQIGTQQDNRRAREPT